MRLPSVEGQWRKILLNSRCPVGVRLQALGAYNPSVHTLVKLLRNTNTPGRLKAAVLAVYQQKKLLFDTRRRLKNHAK